MHVRLEWETALGLRAEEIAVEGCDYPNVAIGRAVRDSLYAEGMTNTLTSVKVSDQAFYSVPQFDG